MPVTAAPAATIILLRETTGALEVFLVQRHSKSGFFPNAWVFPGGRVEPGDDLLDTSLVSGGVEAALRMAVPRQDAVAFLVAGVRETFEEAGVWLGSGELPWSLRLPLQRGEVTLAAALEEHGSHINLDCVGLFSWWVTPVNERRRYDTRFLVADVGTALAEHDQLETVDSGWFRPAEVLEGADNRSFGLAPPTWWVLSELAVLGTVARVMEASRARPHRPIMPTLTVAAGAVTLVLPGHPDHPEPAIVGLPAALGFREGGWWREDPPEQ